MKALVLQYNNVKKDSPVMLIIIKISCIYFLSFFVSSHIQYILLTVCPPSIFLVILTKIDTLINLEKKAIS